MKKRTFSIVAVLAIGILFLSGCSKKALNPEEFSQVFVNRVIYGQDEEKFNEAYYDAQNFTDQLDSDLDSIDDIFADSFEASGMDLSDEQSASMSTSLLDAVKNQTSYEVTSIEEGEAGSVTVTYSIKGLDFSTLIKNFFQSFMNKVMANPEIATNEDQLNAEAMTILTESMKGLTAKSEAVDVSIRFDIEDGKWYVAEDQQSNAESLLFAFFFGAEDEFALQSELTQVVNELMAGL